MSVFLTRTSSSLALAAALGIALAGCSKNEPVEPAANSPAAEQPASEAAPAVARGDEVKLPPPEQKSTAEQAQILRQFIVESPECQPFHAQLDQASLAAASGQPVTLDMGKLMDDAYKAGCQKKPAGQ